MLPRRSPSMAWMRVLAAALILGDFASPARAAERDASKETADLEDGLSAEARKNLQAGALAFRHGNYRAAETSFARVARLAPDWAPIHYNQAIVAEGRGKIGDAIRSYQRYLPHAQPYDRAVVEARLHDLERRRAALVTRHRLQAALGGLSVAVGAGLVTGGITMLALGFRRSQDEFFESTTTRGLIGGGVASVIVGAGVTFGLGMTLLMRARRTKRNITFSPAASPRLVGGQLGWRF
jgi:tetratricopeptide (TPR) repeat protein